MTYLTCPKCNTTRNPEEAPECPVCPRDVVLLKKPDRPEYDFNRNTARKGSGLCFICGRDFFRRNKSKKICNNCAEKKKRGKSDDLRKARELARELAREANRKEKEAMREIRRQERKALRIVRIQEPDFNASCRHCKAAIARRGRMDLGFLCFNCKSEKNRIRSLAMSRELRKQKV